MSECKAYRRELGGAADGRAVGAGARAHADACRACGAELREHEALRALVGGLGRVEAPADFEFRLRARLSEEKGRGGRGRFGGLRLVYGFAPVAAAALFLVISATLYFRQASDKAPAGPAEMARSVQPPASAPPVTKTTDGGARPEGKVELAAPPAPVALKPHAALASSRKGGSRKGRAVLVAAKGAGRVSLAREKGVEGLGAGGAQGLTIALKAPAEPLRMILRDERGARRVVPMRSVSFGSQDLLARETALRQSANAEVEGVW